MRGADGVKVSGKVEVDLLHRHDLRVAAPCRASFRPEARAEGRLANGHDGALAELPERVGKSDGRRGLPLARGSRRHGGDKDQRPVGLSAEPGDGVQADLGLVGAVRLDVGGVQPQIFRDLGDRPEPRGARNLDIALARWIHRRF